MLCMIEPSVLTGCLTVPPSKSQTLRALVFALMGTGKTVIHSPLHAEDTTAMIGAIRALGAAVAVTSEMITVEGVGPELQSRCPVIDAGNSGLVLRLIGGLAPLLTTETTITGTPALCSRRSIAPLVDGLTQLGARANSTHEPGYPPLIVRGPLQGGNARIEGRDSQPVSALLLAGAFSPCQTELTVQHPGETPWIDLTLDWLDRFHLSYEREGYHRYILDGKGSYRGFTYTVPGDLSSSSYPLAAAAVTGSSLKLDNVDLDDKQGDRHLFPALQAMGMTLDIDRATRTLRVQGGSTLKGLFLDVNPMVDALPLLAVLGCYAKGTTTLYNGASARGKESDRIHAITTELKKMGAAIEEEKAGITVRATALRGAKVKAHGDHRIAMALSVAALGATGPSIIEGIECVAKTYPWFVDHLKQLGAKVRYL